MPEAPRGEVMDAYVGKKKCGCYVFAVVDDPEYKRDTARAVAKVIREGLVVEHVTVEEARKLIDICDCKA